MRKCSAAPAPGHVVIRSCAVLAAVLCASVSPVGAAVVIGTLANETLNGTSASDAIYGDFFVGAGGFPDISLPCIAGAGASGPPSDGLDSQVVSVGNDRLNDGAGDDIVIGDAAALQFTDFQIVALSGTGAAFGGAGGDLNQARCFSDVAPPAQGRDVFVGDAYFDSQAIPGALNLDASTGSAGMGRGIFYPYGPGGDGGDRNGLFAFNDDARNGDIPRGSKILVGDGYGKSPLAAEVLLVATAGSGAAFGGSGGSQNVGAMFSDKLEPGSWGNAAPQVIVGDTLIEAANGDSRLVASAGSGGQSGGGRGGNRNWVQAFTDTIESSNAASMIVGDSLVDAGPRASLVFEVTSGYSPSGGGLGGFGNSANAFYDEIRGFHGADMIIGDGWNKGASDAVEIFVGGDSGNFITAFNDRIFAFNGNDTLHGDLRFEGEVCEIDQFEIAGGFSGRSTLFADMLYGGFGDDVIHGGFGADTMEGNFGRNRFVYYLPDLAEIEPGVLPVDNISDFRPVFGTDKIDLRPLLNCTSFDPGDDPNGWLRFSSPYLEIDLDGPAGPLGFRRFVQAFPPNAIWTVNGLIQVGALLVPD